MTRIRECLIAGIIGAAAIGAPSGRAFAAQPAQVVKIAANKYHFTPDQITLVKGQPVTLELTSNDVTHGFMLRALKIDTDIRAGQVTQITVTPATSGTFKAICDHYCGFGHGGMKMTVVVREIAADATSATRIDAAKTAMK
ncbi:MAG TPA: cupredoxin domain-containing protein [Candidatus Binataceae bacterium]|nr:cupredoxin domain-containing protein [Candidatus Binataceae bacterium]